MTTTTEARPRSRDTDVEFKPLDLTYAELSDLLVKKAHVRGKPVAISLFYEEIPVEFQGASVEPCAIVYNAMDLKRRVFIDAEHHDCVSGVYQAGLIAGTDRVRTGRYLSEGTPYFTDIAAARVKSGVNVLPPGLVRGIGAAPLDDVPDGVRVDWVVVVCDPLRANVLGAARSVQDGIMPRGACGTSLCGELFAVPWHEHNVIITPGDMGGRMYNKLKPHEMFVIIPTEFLGSIPTMLNETPDVPGLLESIKPGGSHRKLGRRAGLPVISSAGDDAGLAPPIEEIGGGPAEQTDVAMAEEPRPDVDEKSLSNQMPWDDAAAEVMLIAPQAIIDFAVPDTETYAKDHGYETITFDVLAEQLKSNGLDINDMLAMGEDDDD